MSIEPAPRGEDRLPRETVQMLRDAAKEGLFELVELNSVEDYRAAGRDINVDTSDITGLLA